MTSRIQLAAAKGCDGVEPDIMDAWDPDNVGKVGKPISGKSQLRYNKFIASTAHIYNLSVGLKNDFRQLEDLVDYFDFAVNEQCFEMTNVTDTRCSPNEIILFSALNTLETPTFCAPRQMP